MTPVRFTIKDGVEYFHYKFSDLREFVKYSYEGCTGLLLISRDQKLNNYKGTGTFDKLLDSAEKLFATT